MASDHRCLITGATGFIGGHLAQRLVAGGHQVRCLVRATSDTSLLDELGVELVVGDLVAAPSLADVANGCTAVFHCGAQVSDWATVAEIRRTNVEGTRGVLEAAARAGVGRFVHVSSTDVYGYPGGSGIDETYATARFRNWYSRTKRDAEAEVRRLMPDAVILRPATVYGPRSTDVVGEIARAMREGWMILIDGGRANAGLLYVDNLVDAAMLALHHEAAPGQAFNVTDALDVTWKRFTDDLAEGLDIRRRRWAIPYRPANGIGFTLEQGYRLLRRTTGLTTAPLITRQAVHVLGISQDFSNRKLREVLGWEPRVGYAEGFDATLAWLKAER